MLAQKQLSVKLALHENRLEIRSIVAILVGFWDSFLVGVVSGGKSELVSA